MVADSKSHEAEDKARRDLIDARNQGDGLAYSVERTLLEHRSKLPAEEASRVETGIAQLREALKSDDVAAIRQATEVLQHASHAMAERL